jgi:hypothetical protein
MSRIDEFGKGVLDVFGEAVAYKGYRLLHIWSYWKKNIL